MKQGLLVLEDKQMMSWHPRTPPFYPPLPNQHTPPIVPINPLGDTMAPLSLFSHWLFPRSPIGLPDDNGVTSFPFSHWLFPRFTVPSWS